jgi:hypothetical protein
MKNSQKENENSVSKCICADSQRSVIKVLSKDRNNFRHLIKLTGPRG